MAKEGDQFVPMTGWSVIAMPGNMAGIEVIWAPTEEALQSGYRETARLLIAAEKAPDFAQAVLEQSAMAQQRSRPQ